MTDYERKFSAAMQELVGAGVQRSARPAGVLRLARKIGFRPRPPLYATALSISIILGTTFAVFWGVAMNVSVWTKTSISADLTLASSIVAGALFGLITAMFLRFVHRWRKLSPWEDL